MEDLANLENNRLRIRLGLLIILKGFNMEQLANNENNRMRIKLGLLLYGPIKSIFVALVNEQAPISHEVAKARSGVLGVQCDGPCRSDMIRYTKRGATLPPDAQCAVVSETLRDIPLD